MSRDILRSNSCFRGGFWRALGPTLGLLLPLLWAPLPWAAPPVSPIYVWIDAQGALHATNQLQDVPEPFFQVYRARRDAVARAQRAAGAAGADGEPQQTPQPVEVQVQPAHHGAAQQQADGRMQWKARVLRAHQDLLATTQALETAEAALAQARQNPLLIYTGPQQQKIAVAQGRVDAARQAALAARSYLTEALPKRAKAEGVPPLWLLP